MPYPDELEGAYLEYVIDKGRNSAKGLMFDQGGLLPFQITANSVRVYHGGPIENGRIPMQLVGPTWTFTYLRYVPGAVTIAPLRPGPILTGPMSGCFLCKYKFCGQQMIAHIGTGPTPQSAETIDVLTDWESFLETLPANDALSVIGFNPYKRFDLKQIEAERLGGEKFGEVPSVMGYFDGESVYAMLLAPLPDTMHTLAENGIQKRMVKVAKIIPVETLRSWSHLAASRLGWRSALKAATITKLASIRLAFGPRNETS
jgi:hypothetical protein